MKFRSLHGTVHIYKDGRSGLASEDVHQGKIWFMSPLNRRKNEGNAALSAKSVLKNGRTGEAHFKAAETFPTTL